MGKWECTIKGSEETDSTCQFTPQQHDKSKTGHSTDSTADSEKEFPHYLSTAVDSSLLCWASSSLLNTLQTEEEVWRAWNRGQPTTWFFRFTPNRRCSWECPGGVGVCHRTSGDLYKKTSCDDGYQPNISAGHSEDGARLVPLPHQK